MIKDKIIVSAITPKMIPVVWHMVSPMIEMAIEHSNGELDLDHMYKRLLDSEMVLLTISEGDRIVASLTVEKRDFPSGKRIMNITTAGGADLHLWMADLDGIMDQLAIEHGCSEIYIVGRPGWLRLLKDIGYERIHTVVSKKVGEG